jgi:hypothetical protein
MPFNAAYAFLVFAVASVAATALVGEVSRKSFLHEAKKNRIINDWKKNLCLTNFICCFL